MDKNLLSRLRKQIEWRSVVKVLLPALLLLWVWRQEFALVPILSYFAALAWGYLTESQERKQFRASFWLLALTALAGLSMAAGSAPMTLALVASFVVGLGLQFAFFRFVFPDRETAYGLYHLALTLAIFLVFFASSVQWLSLIFAAGSLSLLMREYFTVTGTPWKMRTALMGLGIGFLLSEVALITRMLPLGAVNAAVFMALIALLTRDAARAHFEGRLTLSGVLRGIAIFLFVSVIIFALSLWRV